MPPAPPARLRATHHAPVGGAGGIASLTFGDRGRMAEVGSIYEPERHVRDVALNLECHIYGHAPVQADGRVSGRPLYFRARHSGWLFTLSPDADIDPAGLAVGEEPGFFAGEVRVYALWG